MGGSTTPAPCHHLYLRSCWSAVIVVHNINARVPPIMKRETESEGRKMGLIQGVERDALLSVFLISSFPSSLSVLWSRIWRTFPPRLKTVCYQWFLDGKQRHRIKLKTHEPHSISASAIKPYDSRPLGRINHRQPRKWQWPKVYKRTLRRARDSPCA